MFRIQCEEATLSRSGCRATAAIDLRAAAEPSRPGRVEEADADQITQVSPVFVAPGDQFMRTNAGSVVTWNSAARSDSSRSGEACS